MPGISVPIDDGGEEAGLHRLLHIHTVEVSEPSSDAGCHGSCGHFLRLKRPHGQKCLNPAIHKLAKNLHITSWLSEHLARKTSCAISLLRVTGCRWSVWPLENSGGCSLTLSVLKLG